MEVEIEKLVYGGDGLARMDGQVILTPFVLPAERIKITTEKIKNGLLRGVGPEIIRSSPERVVPICEYFADCGGCHYQQSNYEFQLASKRAILNETLQRIGGISYQDEIATISGHPWNYRNRIQLHFQNRKCGFHRVGSHDVRPIARCYISSPVLNDVIQELQGAVTQPQWPEFLRTLEVFTDESAIELNIVDSTKPVAARFFEWCGSFLPKLADKAIEYRAGEFTYRVSRGSFFQVNRFLIEALAKEAVGNKRGRRALDLYAGVGLFSLPLADQFDQVQAVERGGPAFRDLEWNAQRLDSARLETKKGSAEEVLATLDYKPDLIVTDPPRAGLGKQVTAELLRIGAPFVTIVSCDPSTLARDLKILLPEYRIERLTLVDLFPQTYHFETVAHLTKN